MRKILLSFMLALAALAAQAQARLVVWEKGGGKVVYQLAEQPTTTFEQGKLVLRTNTATVSYHLENVLRYTYEGVDNTLVDGISLQPEEALVKIDRTGQQVTFSGLRHGATVSLYGTNGILLEQQRASESGTVTLSVSHRPSGVYVVKTGNQTIKLSRP